MVSGFHQISYLSSQLIRMHTYPDKYHLCKLEPVRNKFNRGRFAGRQAAKSTIVKVLTETEKLNPSSNEFREQRKRIPIIKFPQRSRDLSNSNGSNRQRRPHAIESKTSLEYISLQKVQTDIHKQREVEDPLQPRSIPISTEGLLKHRSLCFRQIDSTKTFDLINQLQGILNKWISAQEGCPCPQPCHWAARYKEWMGWTFGMIEYHYRKTRAKLEIFRSTPAISQDPEGASQTVQSRIKTINNSWFSKVEQNKSAQAINGSLNREKLKNMVQIENDIPRTQTCSSSFRTATFQNIMRNILMCYAIQDQEVGYVQGMNYILSGLLYHIKDEINTYGVFRKLMVEIRSVLLNNFKEGYSHVTCLELLLKQHIYDLHLHFVKIGLDLKLICLSWMITLMASVIPLDFMHLVYYGFMQKKWDFIYRLSLSILVYHKETMMEFDENCEVLVLLSPTNESQKEHDWLSIINYANDITL